MAYAEKRGKMWRSRWRGPDGTLESKPGFTSRKAAENYGRDQEAAIRNNTYVDPHGGRITVTEWVNTWFPAQNLELNTLSTYRYTIEVHILPAFGNRSLASLTPEEIAVWEKQISARGYTGRTALLGRHLKASLDRKCICRNSDPPWCQGDEYVFLGPQNGHFRRSNYAIRVVRPAADGWHPARQGRHPRGMAPVLVDAGVPWPGAPIPPWPPALSGVPFTRRQVGGSRGWLARTATGAAPPVPAASPSPGRAAYPSQDRRGGLSRFGQGPADPVLVASWLPIRPGLTPHGLRHGHQTWLDELGVRYVLQSERMGHQVPGMRGVYSHVTPRMRAELRTGLQDLWEASLHERALLAKRSAVKVLDELLAALPGR